MIEKFTPLIKSLARYLNERYYVDKEDLMQEGYMALLECQDKVDFDRPTGAQVNYIKLRVVGAMKQYVSKNYGPVNIPNNKFWTEGFASLKADSSVTIDYNNPEELLIQKEEETMLDDAVIHFIKDLNAIEQLIFYKCICIYIENPTSIRDVALQSGISKSTVGRIKKDLEEKWRKYLNEQTN